MRSDAEIGVKRCDMRVLREGGLGVLRHADARASYSMWEALRGDRAAPFRAELDAGKVGARAPYLAIFEMVGPSNFRVRVAGDRLNRWFGLELRGMSALTLTGAPGRNHLQALLNRVVNEPAVAALHGAARARDGFSTPFEGVALPMRSDFGPVDRVLFGLWLLGDAAPTGAAIRLDIDAISLAPISAGATASPADTEAADAGEDDAPRRRHLRLVKTDAPQRRK